mgnify:CR=1 FL=1
MTIHTFLHRKFIALGSLFCKRSMLIQPYTSSWVEDFQQLKQVMDAGLHGLDYSIEHVGSTAVSGLDAKAIIDMDIIYAEPAVFDLIKERLESIGYYYNGNQGIVGRDVFRRRGDDRHPILDGIKHHLYVCQQGSPALERHVLFRDYLRKHAWARLAYQNMKYQLAAETYQDKHWYGELKMQKSNAFIDAIIAKAKSERI